MDKKFIILTLAMVLFLMLWQSMLPKLFPPTPEQAEEFSKYTNNLARQRIAATNQPAEAPTYADEEERSSLAAVAQQSATTNLPAAQQPEQVLTLTNQFARFHLTTHGAGLKHAEMMNHFQDLEKKQNPILLNKAAPVPAGAIEELAGLSISSSFDVVNATQESITFKTTSPIGAVVTKTISLSDAAQPYVLNFKMQVSNPGGQALPLPDHFVNVGTAAPLIPSERSYYVSADYHTGDKTKYYKLDQILKKSVTEHQSIPWAAVKNQFFALILTLQDPATEFQAKSITLDKYFPNEHEAEGLTARVKLPGLTLAPGATYERIYSLYAGPKELKHLAALANDQDEIMEYGFWGIKSLAEPLCKFMLFLLTWLNSLVKNWGVAIILLTTLIKIVFWPLSAASHRSMKRMQALAPKLQKLKEKYGDDQQRLGQETIKMYKEEKVNPLGGCLPILVQIPVFVSLFFVMQSAVELRGAHFLYIEDLSSPDTIFYMLGIPFNLMPLLMGATSVLQMKLTPQSPGVDPMQQKIMMLMPLMFVFICYNFASGLALYYTVQNLLSIVQMQILNRSIAMTSTETSKHGKSTSSGRS